MKRDGAGIARFWASKDTDKAWYFKVKSETEELRASFWGFDVSMMFHMGVSVNGGTPKTPQNGHF